MKLAWQNDWPLDSISARLNTSSGNILLATAAYRYETKTNFRAGGIFLYDLNASSTAGPYLTSLASMTGSGVYSCSWLQDENSLIATFASGDMVLLKYCISEIATLAKLKLSENAVLTNVSANENDQLFTCGDHSGSAYLAEKTQYGLTLRSQWIAHNNAPTWSSVFDSQRDLIYTCGDDSLILAWDMRELSSHSRPVWSLPGHDAGVCAVLPISGTNLMVSGSYDETIRVWDLRYHSPDRSFKWNGSRVVDTLKLGCGVWQIKKRMINASCHSLLGACLEGGAVVAGLDCTVGKLHLLKDNSDPDWADFSGTDDSQLVYGVDYTPDSSYFVACTHSSKNGTGSIQLYTF